VCIKLVTWNKSILWCTVRKTLKKRHAMYTLQCNIAACSPNHCRSGKAISITYSECVCSLRYPACNAHAPYCHLWPVRLYNIFPPYPKICTIFFGKKVLDNKMCVLIFSTSFSWNISHSNKKSTRYEQKCILVIM